MDWNTLLHGTRERLPLNTRIDTVINNLQSGEGYCVDIGSAYAPEQLKKAVRACGYEYLGADIRKTPGVVQCDITSATQMENCFGSFMVSAVLCIDVIEHLKKWPLAINNMHGVLKKHGLLYLHFPIYFVTGESEKIEPDQWGHVWKVSAEEVLNTMKISGFDILRVLLKFDTGDALIIATKK
jgi:hypothetical protein